MENNYDFTTIFYEKKKRTRHELGILNNRTARVGSEEDMDKKKIKLPMVIKIGLRTEKTMIMDTKTTTPAVNSSPSSSSFSRSNRKILPRLEKARSFVNMPDDPQVLLNKLISIKLLQSPLPPSPVIASKNCSSCIIDQHHYKSTMFSLDPLWSRMEATAGSMNYILVSILKRGDESDENDAISATESLGTVIVKHKNSLSSSTSLLLSPQHRTHKLFIMKAIRRISSEFIVHSSFLSKKLTPSTSELKKTTTTNAYKIIEENATKQTSACPNLSRVIQTCLSADCRFVYFIREYANETFEDVLRGSCCYGVANEVSYSHRVCVPFRLIKNWLLQAANALDYLHNSLNTCHSNLKPSNVLLVGSQIKLADFLLEPTSLCVRRIAASPRNRPYLPSESLESFIYLPKSDVYSLGVIFSELLGSKNSNSNNSLGKNNFLLFQPDADPDEYFVKILNIMLAPKDTDRPASNDLVAILKFFESIEFSRRLSTSNFVYLIKFKQATNDKKYLLKAINLNDMCKKDVLNDISRVLPSHENILGTTRYFLIDLRIYVMRDYYDDQINLKVRLNQHHPRKIDENIIFQKWLGQIIDGLKHLHFHNLLHSNLKLENVLIRVKDDQIKLTDFGFNYRLSYTTFLAPEAFKESGQYSKHSDVYQLGCLLLECIRSISDSLRKPTNLDDFYQIDVKILDDINFNKRTKNCIRQMLDKNPYLRPTLDYVKAYLINPFYVDLLHGNRLAPIELDRKIFTLEGTNDDSFLAIGYLKRRGHAGYSMSKLRFDENSIGIIEKMNFNSALLMARNRVLTTNCSCSKYTQMSMDFPGILPKILCLIDGSFFIGCNTNFVYFFDDHLKYMKRMCLLEMLESTPKKMTMDNRRHSNMVKKHELKLEVNSICIDKLHANIYRIYLLLTVLNEVCLLNFFRLDLNEFNRQSNESTLNFDICDPTLYLENSIHLSILRPDLEKTMKCNCNYLFVCERSHKVRVFSKHMDSVGKYLFSLDRNSGIIDNRRDFIGPRLQFNLFDQHGSVMCSPENNIFYSSIFGNRLQDLDVDKRNGFLYVIFDYLIRVYDENCEPIWEYDIAFRSDLIGKLTRVCFTSNGCMALVLEDTKNEFSNRVYFFN